MDWKNVNIEKMAENVSKNYVQPHILIRWLMLYREINKIIPFINHIIKKENDIELSIIPLTHVLCEQILDEIKITPKNQKYLSKTEEILQILISINHLDVDPKNKFEQNFLEGNIFRKVNALKTKIFQLFLSEKHNIKDADFSMLDKENIQELLDIFKLLNSQTENHPL